MAMCGFTEVLSFILCSLSDNFAMLNHEDDGSTAVIIENPRSSENEVCILNLVCFSYTLTMWDLIYLFLFISCNFMEWYEPCICLLLFFTVFVIFLPLDACYIFVIFLPVCFNESNQDTNHQIIKAYH